MPAGVPQRKILAQKERNRSSPAHTSRGMPIPLLDMMSRSPGRQNRLYMTLIIPQSRTDRSQRADRTMPMCGIIVAAFRVIHGKIQGRKQNPVRKSTGSKSSSREKTVLRERKRNLTVAMLTVRQKAVFPKSRMSLQSRTLLWRMAASRPEIQRNLRTITAAGILTTGAKKRADTAGGNIRTGNARKSMIPGMISRQRITLLQKTVPLPMAQNRNFRAARNWKSCKRKRRKPGERPKPQGRSCRRKRNIP